MTLFLIFSLVLYIVFDFSDGRRPRDEREELIQRKALVFAHKSTMATLCLLTALAAWRPHMISLKWFLAAMIFAALYTEMAGKFYYRHKH